MTKGRMAAAIAVAFVVSEILAIVVHGVLLNAQYEPFRGTLLRSGPSWQMLFLSVAHLFYVSALVWISSHVSFDGSITIRGATLGVVGWMAGQAPVWLLWYGEEPWPGSLLIQQLVLEFASSLILGITIAAIARRQPRGSVAAAV
jgi:hypothetical protein